MTLINISVSSNSFDKVLKSLSEMQRKTYFLEIQIPLTDRVKLQTGSNSYVHTGLSLFFFFEGKFIQIPLLFVSEVVNFSLVRKCFNLLNPSKHTNNTRCQGKYGDSSLLVRRFASPKVLQSEFTRNLPFANLRTRECPPPENMTLSPKYPYFLFTTQHRSPK